MYNEVYNIAVLLLLIVCVLSHIAAFRAIRELYANTALQSAAIEHLHSVCTDMSKVMQLQQKSIEAYQRTLENQQKQLDGLSTPTPAVETIKV